MPPLGRMIRSTLTSPARIPPVRNFLEFNQAKRATAIRNGNNNIYNGFALRVPVATKDPVTGKTITKNFSIKVSHTKSAVYNNTPWLGDIKDDAALDEERAKVVNNKAVQIYEAIFELLPTFNDIRGPQKFSEMPESVAKDIANLRNCSKGATVKSVYKSLFGVYSYLIVRVIGAVGVAGIPNMEPVSKALSLVLAAMLLAGEGVVRLPSAISFQYANLKALERGPEYYRTEMIDQLRAAGLNFDPHNLENPFQKFKDYLRCVQVIYVRDEPDVLERSLFGHFLMENRNRRVLLGGDPPTIEDRDGKAGETTYRLNINNVLKWMEGIRSSINAAKKARSGKNVVDSCQELIDVLKDIVQKHEDKGREYRKIWIKNSQKSKQGSGGKLDGNLALQFFAHAKKYRDMIKALEGFKKKCVRGDITKVQLNKHIAGYYDYLAVKFKFDIVFNQRDSKTVDMETCNDFMAGVKATLHLAKVNLSAPITHDSMVAIAAAMESEYEERRPFRSAFKKFFDAVRGVTFDKKYSEYELKARQAGRTVQEVTEELVMEEFSRYQFRKGAKGGARSNIISKIGHDYMLYENNLGTKIILDKKDWKARSGQLMDGNTAYEAAVKALTSIAGGLSGKTFDQLTEKDQRDLNDLIDRMNGHIVKTEELDRNERQRSIERLAETFTNDGGKVGDFIREALIIAMYDKYIEWMSFPVVDVIGSLDKDYVPLSIDIFTLKYNDIFRLDVPMLKKWAKNDNNHMIAIVQNPQDQENEQTEGPLGVDGRRMFTPGGGRLEWVAKGSLADQQTWYSEVVIPMLLEGFLARGVRDKKTVDKFLADLMEKIYGTDKARAKTMYETIKKEIERDRAYEKEHLDTLGERHKLGAELSERLDETTARELLERLKRHTADLRFGNDSFYRIFNESIESARKKKKNVQKLLADIANTLYGKGKPKAEQLISAISDDINEARAHEKREGMDKAGARLNEKLGEREARELLDRLVKHAADTMDSGFGRDVLRYRYEQTLSGASGRLTAEQAVKRVVESIYGEKNAEGTHIYKRICGDIKRDRAYEKANGLKQAGANLKDILNDNTLKDLLERILKHTPDSQFGRDILITAGIGSGRGFFGSFFSCGTCELEYIPGMHLGFHRPYVTDVEGKLLAQVEIRFNRKTGIMEPYDYVARDAKFDKDSNALTGHSDENKVRDIYKYTGSNIRAIRDEYEDKTIVARDDGVFICDKSGERELSQDEIIQAIEEKYGRRTVEHQGRKLKIDKEITQYEAFNILKETYSGRTVIQRGDRTFVCDEAGERELRQDEITGAVEGKFGGRPVINGRGFTLRKEMTQDETIGILREKYEGKKIREVGNRVCVYGRDGKRFRIEKVMWDYYGDGRSVRRVIAEYNKYTGEKTYKDYDHDKTEYYESKLVIGRIHTETLSCKDDANSMAIALSNIKMTREILGYEILKDENEYGKDEVRIQLKTVLPELSTRYVRTNGRGKVLHSEKTGTFSNFQPEKWITEDMPTTYYHYLTGWLTEIHPGKVGTAIGPSDLTDLAIQWHRWFKGGPEVYLDFLKYLNAYIALKSSKQGYYLKSAYDWGAHAITDNLLAPVPPAVLASQYIPLVREFLEGGFTSLSAVANGVQQTAAPLVTPSLYVPLFAFYLWQSIGMYRRTMEQMGNGWMEIWRKESLLALLGTVYVDAFFQAILRETIPFAATAAGARKRLPYKWMKGIEWRKDLHEGTAIFGVLFTAGVWAFLRSKTPVSSLAVLSYNWAFPLLKYVQLKYGIDHFYGYWTQFGMHLAEQMNMLDADKVVVSTKKIVTFTEGTEAEALARIEALKGNAGLNIASVERPRQAGREFKVEMALGYAGSYGRASNASGEEDESRISDNEEKADDSIRAILGNNNVTMSTVRIAKPETPSKIVAFVTNGKVEKDAERAVRRIEGTLGIPAATKKLIGKAGTGTKKLYVKTKNKIPWAWAKNTVSGIEWCAGKGVKWTGTALKGTGKALKWTLTRPIWLAKTAKYLYVSGRNKVKWTPAKWTIKAVESTLRSTLKGIGTGLKRIGTGLKWTAKSLLWMLKGKFIPWILKKIAWCLSWPAQGILWTIGWLIKQFKRIPVVPRHVSKFMEHVKKISWAVVLSVPTVVFGVPSGLLFGFPLQIRNKTGAKGVKIWKLTIPWTKWIVDGLDRKISLGLIPTVKLFLHMFPVLADYAPSIPWAARRLSALPVVVVNKTYGLLKRALKGTETIGKVLNEPAKTQVAVKDGIKDRIKIVLDVAPDGKYTPADIYKAAWVPGGVYWELDKKMQEPEFDLVNELKLKANLRGWTAGGKVKRVGEALKTYEKLKKYRDNKANMVDGDKPKADMKDANDTLSNKEKLEEHISDIEDYIGKQTNAEKRENAELLLADLYIKNGDGASAFSILQSFIPKNGLDRTPGSVGNTVRSRIADAVKCKSANVDLLTKVMNGVSEGDAAAILDGMDRDMGKRAEKIAEMVTNASSTEEKALYKALEGIGQSDLRDKVVKELYGIDYASYSSIDNTIGRLNAGNRPIMELALKKVPKNDKKKISNVIIRVIGLSNYHKVSNLIGVK